jgi:hypothetical protein
MGAVHALLSNDTFVFCYGVSRLGQRGRCTKQKTTECCLSLLLLFLFYQARLNALPASVAIFPFKMNGLP